MKVKVKAKSNVGENGCGVDLSKEKEFQKLQQLGSEEIKKHIENIMNYAQKKIKTDIFGFGNKYYQQYPKRWKTVERNWDERFSKAQTKIEVDVKVIGSGLIFTEIIGE